MTQEYSGYTGRLLEEKVLGRCVVRWEGYLSWQASLELAKQHQPKKSRHAVALQAAISREVGGDVKFFTTVGTPMDKYHGTDAIFEFDGHVVTLDLTLNSAKDSHKADIVFNPNEDDWIVLVNLVAAEFATKQRRGGNVWHAS